MLTVNAPYSSLCMFSYYPLFIFVVLASLKNGSSFSGVFLTSLFNLLWGWKVARFISPLTAVCFFFLHLLFYYYCVFCCYLSSCHITSSVGCQSVFIAKVSHCPCFHQCQTLTIHSLYYQSKFSFVCHVITCLQMHHVIFARIMVTGLLWQKVMHIILTF